ncbi:transcription initiation factor IIA subunit TFIIA2 [Acrasis kona]|uniref:Transcription initiation factor IIA subunit 2 n=1 Tax=Acrasis kona TaxID=1008807 RepID=A0AAW2ZNC5_9EUKA
MTTNTDTNSYQIYRKTVLGLCLKRATDRLVAKNKISNQLKDEVLAQFDKSINEALTNQIKTKLKITGTVDHYRYIEGVYLFDVKDGSVRLPSGEVDLDRVKVIACDGRQAKAQPNDEEKKKKKPAVKRKK